MDFNTNAAMIEHKQRAAQVAQRAERARIKAERAERKAAEAPNAKTNTAGLFAGRSARRAARVTPKTA